MNLKALLIIQTIHYIETLFISAGWRLEEYTKGFQEVR